MIEQAFGQSRPWSVGLEEELMILDAGTLQLAPGVRTLLAEADGVALPGLLRTELFASIVELNTPTCAGVEEALGALAVLRRFAADASRRHDLLVAAAGSHPLSRADDQEPADDARSREFVAYAGISARRQTVCGLHLHVGMPSAAACHHALEGVLPWLPLVLALSANSPYLEGRETGLASSRAEVLALLPRSGSPPPFRSYGEWEEHIERYARLGLAEDYRRYWWDARLHPRLGTLEIRMPDQPTALERTGALAALLQALCVAVLREPPRPYEPARRADYQQNRWAALRFGHEAELIHPDGERVAGVPELADELLDLVAPAARELGASRLLSALEPAAPEGLRQLGVGRARGLEAVCADLVERTVRSG